MSDGIRGLGPLRRYEREPAPVDLDAIAPPRPRDVAAERELALAVPCPTPRCRRPIGTPCVNVNDRTELVTQPAHLARLRAAGAVLAPTTRTELAGWPTRRTEASRAELVREVLRRQRGW